MRGGLDPPRYALPVSFLRGVARVISWTGLTGIGALHAVWATGSPWPAKNRRRLAEATVGTATETPSTLPTAFVAAAALAAGAVSAGVLGEGRFATGIRRLVGCALLIRGLVGGPAALAVLGMPKPGKTFVELDSRYYRPLCLTLALAAFVGAGRRRR